MWRALGRDRQFCAALLAAPVFWLLLNQGTPRTAAWPRIASLSFVLVALVYPVLEEIVFRGGLQAWLRQTRYGSERWAGISAANAAASLAFSGLHFFFHPPLWAAAALLPSLVFGHFYERHGSLRGPIVLHVFYNTGYYALFGV